MIQRASVVSLVLSLTVAAAAPASELGEAASRDYDAHLGALFLELHRNPELSFLETQTAALLAEELRAVGVEVTQGVGRTGVVGVLRNGDGPVVLVRADMDGLPLKEASGLPYASEVTQVGPGGELLPVMHACGHDVHVTALVGTARRLVALREAWSGTVVFIGQPAEETVSGAKAMLADGLYERFGVPDHALGLHVAAAGPAGRIGMRGGLGASSSDSVDILVRGIGAHGASPHHGKDPVYVASRIVVALQGIVSRELAPLAPGVITVGSIHGGNKHNIIPSRVKLQLTVRADSEETRAQLLAAIERVADGVARSAGVPDDLLPVVTRVEATPTLVNDESQTARLRAALVDALGEDAFYSNPREGMGAEDFSEYLRTEHQVPGTFFTVGGTSQQALDAAEAGGPPIPSHHSPFFRIEPRPAVTSGVHAMTLAVLELLGKER